ncbi:anti-sigma factor [Marivirga sp.]|uniref:anti-sigma factor family protein n=1 Tax=Marivirga sp. TaxID=2018662 RepID=UPI002D80D883|nr:anti-sigma factor [Marivirga sp.]HET8859515.1 anti-sigma factor [Marivirga sp.]
MNDQTMEVEQNQACTELLQLVIDGQATQKQQQELKQHLEECENCREEYLLSKSITESIKNHIKPNQSPNGLANTIQSKILETASLK